MSKLIRGNVIDNIMEVESVHYFPEQLQPTDKIGAIEIDAEMPDMPIASFGKRVVLKYDLTAEKFFFEEVDRELNILEKIQVENNNLKIANMNPIELYQQGLSLNATLNDLKALKVDALKHQCNGSIENGFVSMSLGYKFGFKVHDQNNMQAQQLLFLSDATEVDCDWKTEDAGIVTLTKQEFLAVVKEGKAHVRSNTAKLWSLVPNVMNATTAEEVDAVVW